MGGGGENGKQIERSVEKQDLNLCADRCTVRERQKFIFTHACMASLLSVVNKPQAETQTGCWRIKVEMKKEKKKFKKNNFNLQPLSSQRCGRHQPFSPPHSPQLLCIPKPSSHIPHQPSLWPLVNLCRCCHGNHSGMLSRSDCHGREQAIDTRQQNGGKIKQTILGWSTFNKGCWEKQEHTHYFSPSLCYCPAFSPMHICAMDTHWHQRHAHIYTHTHKAAAAAATVNPIPVTRKNWFRVGNLQKAQFLEAVWHPAPSRTSQAARSLAITAMFFQIAC